MKVSRKWIEYAHGPGAEDGQELATRLIALLEAPGKGSVEVTDPALVYELVDVAELYTSDTDVQTMGPWWAGQPHKVIREGKAYLRQTKEIKEAA